MATGQNHLVTYRAADNIERMFARSPVSGFVALQQTGMGHNLGSNPPPSFGFIPTLAQDDELGIISLTYGTVWSVDIRDIDTLVSSGALSLHFDTQTWARGKPGKKRPTFFVLTRTTALWGVGVLPNKTLTAPYGANSNPDATNNCLAVHPNEECIFTGAAANKSKILKYTADVALSGQNWPAFNDPTTLTLGYAVIEAEFTASGEYMFAVGDDLQLHCFTWDGTDLIEQVGLQLPAGTSVITIAIRPDDRYIAVSTYDGTTYRTFIYRRMGYVARLFQTITNMGQLLAFTADGTRLVDAAGRKCYKFDNATSQFIDVSTEVSNLPTNVTAAAINSMMDPLIATAFGYSEGVRQLVESNVDLANLKLMLLDETASFNAGETNITTLAAFEVSGQGWPVGGKQLANVSIADNAQGDAALIADVVRQILIESITFRYAVIYDDTSNQPLLFIDFRDTIVTEAEKAILFDTSAFGVFTFLP